MSTFIGALLDVSGSMKGSFGDGVDVEGGPWAGSIFRVANDLVKYDVSRDNRVFVIGFGSSVASNSIFDIISTVKQCQIEGGNNIFPSGMGSNASHSTIDSIFSLLEKNGAYAIRTWADIDDVVNLVSEYTANALLRMLQSDEVFARKFVEKYLPPACRNWHENQGNVLLVAGVYRKASREEIKEVIPKAFMKDALMEDALMKDAFMKRITVPESSQSVYNVQDVADVLHGYGEKDLTSKRVQELLTIVEPFIYGGTPLHSALREASYVFDYWDRRIPKHKRLLFILSDGESSERGNLSSIQSKLKNMNVYVVCCYIARLSHVEPRRLHNVPDPHWEAGARFLYDLSSYIPTSLITRAIFIKNGWKIDIDNNETRLFMHVNHPDHLTHVCKLAKKAVCCEDSLSDFLVKISLDIFINKKNKGFKARDQDEDETCYAHAAATVVHLSLHRILGREGGYPKFETLRDDMIKRHGRHGANTLEVLQEVCPHYRLHCEAVYVSGAMKAITKKRPVVVLFRLTNEEWDVFDRFYDSKRDGVLTKSDLDISKRTHDAKTFGHAVVLTSFNRECLRLMNSYGVDWGDDGFFKVENAEVLGMEFIDVYWDENDLTRREQDYYHQHGAEVADELMKSIKALQYATYTCPWCSQESKVNEFTGTLLKAQCPRCYTQFSCNDGKGNILALNMYLISLSK